MENPYESRFKVSQTPVESSRTGNLAEVDHMLIDFVLCGTHPSFTYFLLLESRYPKRTMTRREPLKWWAGERIVYKREAADPPQVLFIQ